jgi:hypothetical protein
MKMIILWSVLLMPCHNNKKKAHVMLDKSLPTTWVLLKIPTTMHCNLTIRDTLQTTATVTAIMTLLLPIPLMMTTKPTIRASLKQGELLLVEHNAGTFLHQKSGAALEHKTVNVELVMSGPILAVASWKV